MKPLDRVRIFTPEGESGELSASESGDYLFRYGLDADPNSQISLTMGVRGAAYLSRSLHPVFQMICPKVLSLSNCATAWPKPRRSIPCC